MPQEKEAPFFSDDDAFEKGYGWYFNEFFGSCGDHPLLGTVTPHYMMSPKVPQRMKELTPNARIIAVLRDPIERAYSHYHMATRVRDETRTFDEAIASQLKPDSFEASRKSPDYWKEFIVFGEYGRILAQFYKLFPKDRMLVLFTDDLENHPDLFMAKIFDFLGIRHFAIPDLGRRHHGSNVNMILSFVARLSFNTRLRLLGKIMPERYRRRVRFWLGLHRSLVKTGLDNRFVLSPKVREDLEELYRRDADIIAKLTGVDPYWVKKWAAGGPANEAS